MPTASPLRMFALGLLTAALFVGNSAFTLAQEENVDAGIRGLPDIGVAELEYITVPSWRLTDGPHVRSAFREAIAPTRDATVRVRCDGRNCALGGILGSDGWIVTKASSLKGKVTCRLSDGREFDARVVGVSQEFDVAMLKIQAKHLPTLNLDYDRELPIGSWVATVGMLRDPVAVGVVSVEPRVIPHRAGVLGIQLDDQTERPVVVRVFEESAAELAGLQVNDRVLSIDEQPTPTRERLIEIIQEHSPGDKLEILVRRDGAEVTLTANLSSRFPGLPMSRDEFQNALGGSLSVRRFGFPNAFQHDTALKATDCGGPLVNLEGEVVGFNIARSGRTESYAVATSSISKLLFELMSGNLEPEPEDSPSETLEEPTSDDSKQ